MRGLEPSACLFHSPLSSLPRPLSPPSRLLLTCAQLHARFTIPFVLELPLGAQGEESPLTRPIARFGAGPLLSDAPSFLPFK